MANLKEIRIRIASVQSTRQITSAMKLVSAAKLRKAQDAIIKMRPYATKLREILTDLSQGSDLLAENDFVKEREINSVLIVAVTSNRGLCGAFNANVIKKITSLLNGEFASQNRAGNVKVMTFGKKATEFYRKKFPSKFHSSHDDLWNNLTWEKFQPIADQVLNMYSEGNFDKVVIVYNEFKNAGNQILTVENLLPVSMENSSNIEVSKHDYILEPNKEVIVNELIPKILKTQFYKTLLDSYASEHGARMTAMHKATDNATDMIKELKLIYNKARQATITNEIIEIVSGANALKG
jgi:F-type H+-transporting ATPase subunit gamma